VRFGWPLEDAVVQALTALKGVATAVDQGLLVLFAEKALALAERVATHM